MKKLLCFFTIIFLGNIALGQTTYYWVGGLASSNGVNTGSNWNTALDGSGTSRPSSTGTTDILIYDGTNVGGATPATGPVSVLANASISFAQMLFVNNVTVTFQRTSTGTSTFTVNGALGEDFVVNAGSTVRITSSSGGGSMRFALLGAVDSARVSGTLSTITPQQFRFDNGVAGTSIFRFTSGASFTTNITSASSSYPFGSASQSSERWVTFENGADLYYEGGYSPMGNSSAFSPIEFQPNSTYHVRSSTATATGSFFNRKSFGNISVENAAVLTADGPIYRINNLTINTGSGFVTHTSGQTVINGNLTVNGNLTSDASSTNEILFGGNGIQTVSGTGNITVQRIIAGDNATVTLNKSVTVNDQATVYGNFNFVDQQILGTGTFTSEPLTPAVTGTVNTSTGSYIITGNTTFQLEMRGLRISGAGIPANTTIVSLSGSLDSIYISNALTATATGITATVSSQGATLQTAGTNGFTDLTGSVAVTGTKNYNPGTNYIIDAATTAPFGISTGAAGVRISAPNVTINAPVTSNTSVNISALLTLNAKLTLRPLDTLHILNGANLAGTFDATKYVATDYNAAGQQALFQFDGITTTKLLPIGTVANYLPVTITPTTSSDFTANVFRGITTNGLITGTPYTAAQKQLLVDAVWTINRVAGSGNADITLQWSSGLEGSTFSTLPDTSIGLIRNTGTAFSLPMGIGNNALNFVTANLGTFGAVSAGAKPPSNPFTFNAIPVKTYGAPDFNPGATSLNTINPIVYSSSNPAVATIIGNNIHITGAGTTQITASQDGDGGLYDTVAITRTLTVNKAPLTIKADQKTRFEQTPNPTLTATYTGFVLGETPANLLTTAVLSTTAVTTSAPGNYPITVSGATSNNYEITFINDTLKVIAKTNQTITFAALPAKVYGNANFSAGATSTNATIPLTYSSSNTSVATISSTGIITITGAGTTTITVSQAGSAGFFPAPDVVRTLTVSKAPLIIGVRDTSRLFGQPNPAFTFTYNGLVLNETAANLSTQPQITTSANVNSIPGIYTITPGGAVSQNYSITYTAGRLTILPATDPALQQLYAYHTGGGNIQVRIYSAKAELGDILIYDMNGRMLARRNTFIPVGFATTNISIPTLQSGSYVVAVRGVSGGVVQLQTIFQLIR